MLTTIFLASCIYEFFEKDVVGGVKTFAGKNRIVVTESKTIKMTFTAPRTLTQIVLEAPGVTLVTVTVLNSEGKIIEQQVG